MPPLKDSYGFRSLVPYCCVEMLAAWKPHYWRRLGIQHWNAGAPQTLSLQDLLQAVGTQWHTDQRVIVSCGFLLCGLAASSPTRLDFGVASRSSPQACYSSQDTFCFLEEFAPEPLLTTTLVMVLIEGPTL